MYFQRSYYNIFEVSQSWKKYDTLPSKLFLAISTLNFKHICIVKKFHIQNVVRHNRVLLKLDVDIIFCNSCTLTLVSDGLDSCR